MRHSTRPASLSTLPSQASSDEQVMAARSKAAKKKRCATRRSAARTPAGSLLAGLVALALVAAGWHAQPTTSDYVDGSVQPLSVTASRMRVRPILAPDNSHYYLRQLLRSANTTLLVQQQYIQKYASSQPWLLDGNPLMQGLYEAKQRGVAVRVIVDALGDTGAGDDFAAPFLKAVGIQVKYMHEDCYDHNKGIVVDGRVVAVSSINWSANSIRQNREAGVIVESEEIAAYFTAAFEFDWANGNDTITAASGVSTTYTPAVDDPYTAAPVFTLDNVQVTAFLNPDNSYPFITNWWAAANETFHAEMYQLTINDLTDRLISMKTNAPWLDQTIIMSRYRAGADSATTANQAKLAAAGIDVYKSRSDLNFQHSKFWMINRKIVFIYSGNWSGTSITLKPKSTSANREWGLAFEDPCFVAYWTQLMSQDRQSATVLGSYCFGHYDSCGYCNGTDVCGNECATSSVRPSVATASIKATSSTRVVSTSSKRVASTSSKRVTSASSKSTVVASSKRATATTAATRPISIAASSTVVDDSHPSPSSSSNTGLIAGAAVGGVLALVLMVVVVAVVLRRRRGAQRSSYDHGRKFARSAGDQLAMSGSAEFILESRQPDHEQESMPAQAVSKALPVKPARPAPAPRQVPTGDAHRAIYAYTPQSHDELELVVGDVVYVTDKAADGWYTARSLRTNMVGVCPGTYVEPCAPSKPTKPTLPPKP